MTDKFKILTGVTWVDSDDLFMWITGDRMNSRGGKLWLTRSRPNVRVNAFCNRVVGTWNRLSTERP